MAKKVNEQFVVLDENGCCVVDDEGVVVVAYSDVVFDNEKLALEMAQFAIQENEDSDNQIEDDTVIVYKLIPMYKVTRAKTVVEKA